MVIALLAVLGVTLIVIVAATVTALGGRRWVSRQDGAFRGIAWIIDGELASLSTRSKRGNGRWVHHVLVWTPAPFFLTERMMP